MLVNNTNDPLTTTAFIISILIVVMIGILVVVCVWRRNHSRGYRASDPEIEDSSKSAHEREVFDFGNEIRITLLGKTGNGKSATGNLILGDDLFETKICARSVTAGCKRERKKRFGVNIEVVDTPGLCDTTTPNETVFKEIVKCIAITSPGPHAFLLVLSVTSRFTPEEEETVNNFISRFGELIFQYLIVIITRQDDLEREKMTRNQYLADMPPSLKTFLQKCGDRCMFLNNRDSEENKEKQCFELLTKINDNVKGKSCPYYTDEAYQNAEKLFKEKEEEKLKKINEDLQKQIDEKMACMKASTEEKERKNKELLEEKDKMLDEMRAKIRENYRKDVENESTKEEGTFKSFIGNLRKIAHGAVDATGDLIEMSVNAPNAARKTIRDIFSSRWFGSGN